MACDQASNGIRSDDARPARIIGESKTSPECIVKFDGDEDPCMPRNWPRGKKLLTTVVYALITMSATWTTSMYATLIPQSLPIELMHTTRYSPAASQVQADFGVSKEVALLGLTFCLLE